MSYKTFTIEFRVPTKKESNWKLTKDGKKFKVIQMEVDVKGMMAKLSSMIVDAGTFDRKERLEMIQEYCKFWLFDKAGIETYPVEK